MKTWTATAITGRKAMMKPFLFGLLFSLSFPVVTAAQAPLTGWRQSLVSGDPVETTEVRALVEWGGKLFAATGGYQDQGGEGGKGGANVVRLDSPNGRWQLETSFGFEGADTNALVPLHWGANKSGKPVDTWTLVASASWSNANAFTRNEVDLKWYRTDFGPGQIRAFGVHEDKVAHEWVGFAGGKPNIIRGQLTDSYVAGKNPIQWVTGPEGIELNTSPLTDPVNCFGGGRATGFAEARGKIYASACWKIFERVDGPRGNCAADEVNTQGTQCEARWKAIWADPLAGNSETGLRGLTAISYQGKQVLLVGSETKYAHITRVDPGTGEGVVELDLDRWLGSLTGVTSGASYKVIPYNSPAKSWIGPDDVARRIFGFQSWLAGSPSPGLSRSIISNNGEATPSSVLGEAMFLVRLSDKYYYLQHIPQITNRPMQAVRECLPSPFPEECKGKTPDGYLKDCELYCAGFDTNISSVATPCYADPCTVPPLILMPIHRTGWIVKGRLSIPGVTTGTAANAGTEQETDAPHREP